MRGRIIALAVAALALGTAGQASAQSRGDAGWWPWVGGSVYRQDGRYDKKAQKRARKEAEDRAERIRSGRYDDDRGNDRRGNGPPFCRNGQGHPVKGMEWCREKGWAPASWQSIVYRSRVPNGSVRQPTLRDILGSVILGRFTDYSQQLGARGPLEGRSFYAGDASVLQLRAGGVPIAELSDLDRDGRVDLVLLANRR
jgi:hypothetical protein